MIKRDHFRRDHFSGQPVSYKQSETGQLLLNTSLPFVIIVLKCRLSVFLGLLLSSSKSDSSYTFTSDFIKKKQLIKFINNLTCSRSADLNNRYKLSSGTE